MKKMKLVASMLCLALGVSMLAGCPAQPADPTSSITPSDGGTVTPSTNPSPSPSVGPTVGKLPETQVEVKTDPATTVFVDAVKGNDANAGTVEAPVKTLAKAQELVRSKNAIMRDDIVVYLRGGTYVLDNTLTFTQEDSGKNGYDVIWTAYKGENVVISGGSTVSGWTLHDKDKNIWVASANGVKSYDFYVNGERATVARGPELVPLNAALIDEKEAVTMAAGGAYGDTYARAEDMVLVSQRAWVYNHAKIEKVAREDNFLRFYLTDESWNRLKQIQGLNTDNESLLYFENAYEFLDTAGEWYLNAGEDKVYYIPKAGEDLTKAETVLGKLEKIIDFNGELDKVVENITVTGMTFKYSTWLEVLTDSSVNVVQSNVYRGVGGKYEMPMSAIWGQFVNNVNITYNVLEDLGSGGVHLWRATKNSSIANNVVRNCASSGISLGGFEDKDHHPIKRSGNNYDEGIKYLTENCKIIDNFVDSVGEVYKSACGILVGYVARTNVEYNTLVNLPYSGISFGWGWGYSKSEMGKTYYMTDDGKFLMCDNTICYNYIENIMNVMFDGGGIYTLGRNDNTLMKGNYINKVNNDYGAIYLDNGSYGFEVTDNVISNAHRNWIYKGDYNQLYDNYTSPDTAQQPDLDMKELYKKDDDSHYRFENNYMWDAAKVNTIKEAAGVRW